MKYKGIPVWIWGITSVAGIATGLFIMKKMRETQSSIPHEEEKDTDTWKPVGVMPVPYEQHQKSEDFSETLLKKEIDECNDAIKQVRTSIAALHSALSAEIADRRKRATQLPQPSLPPPPQKGRVEDPFIPKIWYEGKQDGRLINNDI